MINVPSSAVVATVVVMTAAAALLSGHLRRLHAVRQSRREHRWTAATGTRVMSDRAIDRTPIAEGMALPMRQDVIAHSPCRRVSFGRQRNGESRPTIGTAR